MALRKSWWLPVGGSIALLAALLVWLAQSEREREAKLEPIANDAGRASEAPADLHAPQALVEVARARELVAPEQGQVRIRVLSSQGAPIPEAALCEHRRSRWSSSAEPRAEHARADGEGVIRLAAPRPIPPGLWVFAEGYVPRELGALPPGIEEEVRLDACAALEVQAVTLGGEPLDGVLICAARRALPHVESSFYERARAGEMRASLDPELAIHTALTDADGRARIEGLLPGELHLRATRPGFVLIHEDGVERATVPGPEKVLRFAPLLYDAVEVVGDRVLSFGVEFISSRPMLGTMQTQVFVGEIRRRVEAALPAASCVVVDDDGTHATRPQSVIFDLWLERAGRWRVARPLRRLEGEPWSEQLAAPMEAEREPRGELEVLVRDRLQRSIAVEYEVLSRRVGEQAPSFGLRAMSGTVLPVPAGKGKLSSLRRTQPILLQRDIEIAEGQHLLVEKHFDVALRRYALVVIPPYEDAFERGSVFVDADHVLSASLTLLGSRPAVEFLLPEGRSELRVKVPGFEDEQVVVEVPISDALVDPPRRIEVALRAKT